MATIKRKLGKYTVVKKETTVDELSLPSTPSSPAKSIGDYSILLYGEKKIGKTTLASRFPGAFFLMLEPGSKALSVYQRPVNAWSEFKKYVTLLVHDKRFQTVVIDPVDLAYKRCASYICQKLVIEHLSEEDWGKGWDAARDEFTYEINRLLHIGKGVIFISHAAEKEIKTRTGEKYHKIAPTMSGQARDILEGIVDIWAYYCYDSKARVLYIEGDDHIGAGHRLESRFKYTDGSPIKEIPMGHSPKEAYENFMKAFNNQILKGGAVATKKILRIKH